MPKLRSKWRSFALLLLAVALSFAVRHASPSFRKCQNTEYQTSSGNEAKTQEISSIFLRIAAVHCTAAFVNRYSPLVTALATVLLTAITGGLVWTGLLQIRTVRSQLRAYVFPDGATLWDGTTLDPPIPARTNQPGIVFTWKNSGQTPAFGVVSWGAIAVIEPINEAKLITPRIESKFSNHLGTNAIGTKNLWFGRSLTPSETADIEAGVRAIYFYGRIEYKDIFNVAHYTDFRLSYSGRFPAVPGSSFNISEKGNEAG